jgi:hypothetical protein
MRKATSFLEVENENGEQRERFFQKGLVKAPNHQIHPKSSTRSKTGSSRMQSIVPIVSIAFRTTPKGA